MEEDELAALRGIGKRELLPPDGLPFGTRTGQPVNHEPSIASLPTKDALDLVAWDYDPLTDSIVTGKIRVSEFFDAFKWSEVSA